MGMGTNEKEVVVVEKEEEEEVNARHRGEKGGCYI